MRRVVVLFSHNTHSFIVSEIRYAASSFEKVIVICPKSDEVKKAVSLHKNVEYHPINREKSILTIVNGGYKTGNLFWKEIKEITSSKKISLHYLKLLGLYLAYVSILDSEIGNLLENYNESEIVVVSMWFAGTAFATSIIKEHHDRIYAVSLAHSFEIDDLKNRYVDFLFKRYCHEQLDTIYFISKNVKLRYEETHVRLNNWRFDNVGISYLGVQKKKEGFSIPSNGAPYRLLSCSHCVPVKRLDLIANTLCEIHDINIEWTHIGAGPTLKELKTYENVPKNVIFNLMGNQSNEFVHAYMAENCIDVFINTSSSEGLPVTLMEAIAYGIPVIATDVGGTSELVNSGVGILLEANPSKEQIANAIEKVVTMSDVEKYTMRENAQNCYRRQFNAEILRSEFYAHLQKSGN